MLPRSSCSLWVTAACLSLYGCTVQLHDDEPYESYGTYTTYPSSRPASDWRPARSGPVAAYGFEEGRGSTTNDASDSGITGEFVGGISWPESRSDEGLHFDGVEAYVDLGNPKPLRIEGSLTLSAWIKASQYPWDDATIISKRNGLESGYQLDVTRDLGERTIGFKLTTASGEKMFRYGATTIEPDIWYHVTGVYDADAQEMHVYLDGERDDGTLIGRVDSEQLNSEQNVTIGRRAGATEYEFDGYLDDVRIYDRALSNAEIQTDVETPVLEDHGSVRDRPTVW